MKKIFAVWNASYRKIIVIADDQVEALSICHQTGFFRRKLTYRKFEDQTELLLGGEYASRFESLVSEEKSGVVAEGADGVWGFVVK